MQDVAATTAPTGTTTISTTPRYDPDGNTVGQSTQTADTTSPGLVQTHTYTAAFNAADWQSSTNDDGLLTSYGYDGAGQARTQTVLSGGTPVTTTLNAAGLATSIAEGLGGTPYTSTFGYNPDDLPLTVTLDSGPSQVQETAQYDPASRLSHVSALGPSGVSTPLTSQYDYGYNAVGWTTGMTWTVNGAVTATQLTHDALGRLTAWSGQPNGPESWGYDANGNIITNSEFISDSIRSTVFTYSASQPNEELQQHTDGLGIEYYGYDQTGNTTSLTSTDPLTSTFGVSTSLTYDAQARPITITVKNPDYSTASSAVSSTISFGYNAQGQRSSYTVVTPGHPTLSEHFQYRGDELGQDSVVSGTQSYTATYLYRQDGTPLELLRQTPSGSTLATARYWYEVDGRGNVVALTDLTGTVVDRYAYDLWGAPTSVSEQVPQRLRYTGYWWDQELGWYWVGVRSYDPSLKRWLQPDPGHSDGVRTYVYVGDDPIDATDPTGLQGGAAVAVGAGAGAVCAGTFYIPILGEVDCATAIAILGVGFVASLLAAQHQAIPVPQTQTTTRTRRGELNRAAVQIQGRDINAPGNTLSYSWTQDEPIPASDGLARLNQLWNRLNNRQKRQRRQAYLAAQRYIMSGPSVGGIRSPGFSFRDPTRTIGDARVDVHVYSGVAFSVP